MFWTSSYFINENYFRSSANGIRGTSTFFKYSKSRQNFIYDWRGRFSGRKESHWKIAENPDDVRPELSGQTRNFRTDEVKSFCVALNVILLLFERFLWCWLWLFVDFFICSLMNTKIMIDFFRINLFDLVMLIFIEKSLN